MSSKKQAGPRGGLYHYPVMVRMGAFEKSQLEWLSRRKGKPQGTLVREMVTDHLATLMCKGTPLRQAYDRDLSSKRRNTPMEQALKDAERLDNVVKLVPVAKSV